MPVEGVANELKEIRRSALVGVGNPGRQVPVLCLELETGVSWTDDQEAELQSRLGQTRWADVVKRSLVHDGFPVDPRHNSKIKREELRLWAQMKCDDFVGVVK